MATSRCPPRILIGFLIATAGGAGTRTMDGTGFPTNRWAGRLITMAAGSITATPGAGGQGVCIRLIVRYGDPPGSRFSGSADGTPPSALDLAPSAGCPPVPAIRSSPGGAVASAED